jgi:ADP-ribose pyrophosphatase
MRSTSFRNKNSKSLKLTGGLMEFKILENVIIFEGKVFNILRQRLLMPNNREANYDIVEHVGAVTIVPLGAGDQIWFVRQYRPPAGKMLLELPAGTLSPNEAPEVCAQRELREEIGMAAGKLQEIGEFYLAPGYSTEYQYVFLATDLNPENLPPDEDEFLVVEKIPLKTAYSMLEEGEFKDAKTIAALSLARRHLLV